jgi:hypothetical protein
MQRSAAGSGSRDGEDAQRPARVRRMAIGLALLVIGFYVGFIVWTGINGAP